MVVDVMKALVTGGTGYIGRNLVIRLLEENWELRCLVRENSDTSFLRGEKVEFWKGDITNANTLKGICNDMDIVFNLAAEGDINAVSRKHLELYRKVNVDGTKNLLEECSKNKNLKKIVHFSSVASVGDIEEGIIYEKSICNPATPYGISKREGELVAFDYLKKHNLPIVILRPVMVYGNESNKESNKLEQSAKMRFVPILGNGENLIHIVHVDDLVEVAINSAKKGRPGKIYLIYGESHTWNDMIDLISKNLGIEVHKIHIPMSLVIPFVKFIEGLSKVFGFVPPFTYRRLSNLNKNVTYDTTGTEKDLNFKPKPIFSRDEK